MAKRKRYDKEFRLGVARLVVEQGPAQPHPVERPRETLDDLKARDLSTGEISRNMWLAHAHLAGELCLADPEDLHPFADVCGEDHVQRLAFHHGAHARYCSLDIQEGNGNANVLTETR